MRILYMNRGQVWIESVLYTLIGIALIALVLSFVLPTVNEEKGRLTVEQTIESLNIFDEKIRAVIDNGNGNVRVLQFDIKAGEFYVDGANDKIIFNLTGLEEPYSEPGVEINIGRVSVLSSAGQENSVELSVDYSGNTNIQYEGQDIEKKFNRASVPYRFSIENKGDLVDISVVS